MVNVTVTSNPYNAIINSNPYNAEIGNYGNDADASFVAGAGGVAANHVVYLYTDGKVRTASCNTVSHAGKVIGFTNAEILADATGKVQLNGLITNPLWALTLGSIYYLGIGGEITKIIPTSGFLQQIGIAKSATSLLIKLGEPIILV